MHNLKIWKYRGVKAKRMLAKTSASVAIRTSRSTPFAKLAVSRCMMANAYAKIAGKKLSHSTSQSQLQKKTWVSQLWSASRH